MNLLLSVQSSFNPDLKAKRMIEFSGLVTVKHFVLNGAMYALSDSPLFYLHFIILINCLGLVTNGAYWLINLSAKSSKLVT